MPSFVFPVLIVLQVIAAFTVILLVMLQQGKGADMGSAFGGGSAGSVFGSAGASNFFSRMTKWAAVVFFACTLGLAYIGTQSSRVSTPSGPDAGLMERYSDVPSAPGSDTTSTTSDANESDASVPSLQSTDEEDADKPSDDSVPSLTVPESGETEESETENETTEQ